VLEGATWPLSAFLLAARIVAHLGLNPVAPPPPLPSFLSFQVVELIKEAAARATTALQMVHADALDSAVKYKYCEDDTSEQFFTPYLWSQVLVHSQMWSNMSWNSQRLRLFQLE
jgi:hypothetical protein